MIHRVFEILKHHDFDQAMKCAIKWLPEEQQKLQDGIQFVLSSDQVPLSKIIANGHVEWGYQRQVEGNTIEKRVDLWGVVDDCLYVVDYKTGSTEFLEEAFQQMAEYQDALVQYLNWQGPSQRVAVFPLSKQIFVR